MQVRGVNRGVNMPRPMFTVIFTLVTWVMFTPCSRADLRIFTHVHTMFTVIFTLATPHVHTPAHP